MKKTLFIALLAGILCCHFTVFAAGPSVNQKTVTIGTGSLTGVYYQAGNAVAKTFNKRSENYGLRIKVQSTQGSRANLKGVMSGEFAFGLIQADDQYEAWKGMTKTGEKATQQRDLRQRFQESRHVQCLRNSRVI